VAVVLGFQKGKAKRLRDDSTFVQVQDMEYYRDSLSELSPAIVSLLVDLDIYGENDIVATLLRMQNKKLISLKENGRIVIADEFEKLPDNSERELLSVIKRGKISNKKWFFFWRMNRFQEAERLGYIKRSNTDMKKFKPSHVLFGVASVCIGLVLWCVLMSSDFRISSDSDVIIAHFLLLLINLFIVSPFYFLTRRAGYIMRGDVLWERTPLGNEMAEKIAGLARFIHEFSLLSEASKEHVALWDDYLVFAIILEENDRIVKDIGRYFHANFRGFKKFRR
jgi:uncharacterized membrane protein